ncbi:MAG TPA: dipeptide epimerase [Vicinamibacterales bacterium]|nr:dipeptide epimerase [Vicinamibacterales bacterium]
MQRRDCLKAIGVATVAAAAPQSALASASTGQSSGGRATLRTDVVRLKLRHTWTTTMSSSEYRDTLFVRYTRDGITGVGEGAPIVRYHEDALGGKKAVEGLMDLLVSADPLMFDALSAQINARLENEWAAKAAMDIAILDWVGQRLGVPIYRLFGLDPSRAPVTTFSIGIDKPEETRQKVREADPFPVLKIKVGLDSDEATIDAVRSVTDKPLRVDANEGWKDRQVALKKIRWLQTRGVEFIEQPLPAAMHDDIRWLRERVEMPIIADEACLRPSDIPKLADAYDGVNIKLDKAGGILQAYRMIQIARALGLKTMLGCMVSSSVSVTAAAQLSPLVDYADLDGNLLISNDPYTGVTVEKGKLVLPDRPGLGVRPVD